MHNKMTTQNVWQDEAKSMVPVDVSLDVHTLPANNVNQQTCRVGFCYSNMRCLGFLKRQTRNIFIHRERENRSLIALSKCHYPKLKHMYKLQYVSKSLVSAMQSFVKVSTCVQTSVHEATQTRLEC